MKSKIIILLSLIIIIGFQNVHASENVTNFTLPSNTLVSSFTFQEHNLVYIDIPIESCVINGTMTITGTEASGYSPVPWIDLTNNADYEYGRGIVTPDTTLIGTKVWTNNWCEGAMCIDMLPVINKALSECNARGDSICRIPIIISNGEPSGFGNFMLSNLKLQLIESYKGVLIGKGVCDLDYVCSDPDEDSCFRGSRAEVMLANQRTASMTDCNIYYPEYEYSSLHCDASQSNLGYISVQDSITQGGMEFAKEFFRLNPYNSMGALLFHVTVAQGQAQGLTNNINIILERLQKTLAQGAGIEPCLPCGLYHSQKEFTSDSEVKRAIIVLGDGATTTCSGDILLEGSSTNKNCRTNNEALRIEKSIQQATQYASELYTSREIMTYTIGFGESPQEDNLMAIAASGGGQYFRANNITELIEIYKNLSRLLTGDCIKDCSYQPPITEIPPRVCGDAIIDSPNDEGVFELCDRGTENQLTCDIVEGEELCTVCLPAGTTNDAGELIECSERIFGTPPPGDTYCGDNVRQNPNSVGFPEDCDWGSENKNECTAPCVVCTTECTWLNNTLPRNDPCIFYPAGSPVNLNQNITYEDGRVLDINWVVTDSFGITDSNITENNVLTVDLERDSGRIILEATDTEGRTDLVCFTFGTSRQSYGSSEDPFTRLQIAKGRLVSGYYEEELTGRVVEYGPYLITAQVWQK